MEQGNLRCDVNVSLAPIGSLEWGTRTETKNVNSLRSVERAVRFEMRRQAAVLDDGGRIVQETRHFHEDTGSTSPGPEQGGGDRLPVLPRARPGADRPGRGVGREAAPPRCPSCRPPAAPGCRRSGASRRPRWPGWSTPARVDLVGDTVAAGASPADARKWWLGELARRANDAGVELAELAVTPAQVAELVGLVAAGTINDQLARQTLDGVLAGEGDPAQVVEARGLAVMGESDELVAAVDAAIEGNPDVAEKVRGGKVQAIGALVGAVMKTTRGKADAATVKRMLEERLLRRDLRAGPGGLPAGTTLGSAHLGNGSWPRCDPEDRDVIAASCRRVGGWMRSTRSSSSAGVPTPSRLDVVIHSAPSASSTTVRSRPYWPARNSSGSPVTAPCPSRVSACIRWPSMAPRNTPPAGGGAAAETALLGADLGHRRRPRGLP